ncbi:glycosyltransferase [Candidatus Peregrinibacteria bacterium]|nr:glycosyltransferase [Candidatus Peregrinibacteria bacterium]MBI3816891.1 glycosyltransferase [Candidatus Peregrinibacteria bacterium]
MKIALVHELLTMRGGAENVLRILADMFPNAPIYTLLYDEEKFGDWFPRERIRTSRLHRWTKLSTNHHLFLKSFPSAVETWDFSEFDLVISSSSAFAHGIITNGKPKHLCYVHSPARYLWDRTHDVIEQSQRGLLGNLRVAYLERTFHTLRIWDSEAAERPDLLLAASKEVQRRIELYWRRKSEMLYPPIGDEWFKKRAPFAGQMEHPTYFLVVSSLVRYKRIDLAIRACNQLGAWLKIVGEGPDRRRLENMAGPTIDFLGYCDREKLRELYWNARATIFPGDEDFGLVPLESLACGTPVIAYKGGGALETMIEGETATFFDEPRAESLAEAIERQNHSNFDPDVCRARAKQFSRARFEEGIHTAVENIKKQDTENDRMCIIRGTFCE